MGRDQHQNSLTSAGWNPRLRQRLNSLLAECGRNRSHHSPERPPYAVFDWDNTCIFGDADEAILWWQLTNGAFAATPEQFADLLQAGLAEVDNPGLAALAQDLMASYGHLQEQSGSWELHRQAFRAKFFAFVQGLEQRRGREFAYPWIARRFVGHSPKHVGQLAVEAVSWQLRQPIETLVFQSPAELPGQAGQVEVSWRAGLRLIPEIQELIGGLREAGFEIWVCTASFAEAIRAVAGYPDFGYHLPAERVLGMELCLDKSGRFESRLHPDFEVTYTEGKTEAIRRRLLAQYGYGPALVAGDSDGDASMLQAFEDTQVSIIIELAQPPDSPIGRLLQRAEQEECQLRGRYWSQKRDENEGRFVPNGD